jgi:putative transposase
VEKEVQYKAYKFRLLPAEEQCVLLSKHFGCVRFVYNHFLKEKQDHYLLNKKTLNYNTCAGNLVKMKREGFEWLKEVNSQALQSSLEHLETAYGNFFKKKSKFPKFKSKKSNYDSFSVPQHVSLKNDKIQIPKFKEGIKFIKHREIKGKICSATVSRTPTGKYYISILTEQEPTKHLSKTGKNIGIDLGIKDFAITSEGQRYTNPKFLYKYQKELKRAQQHLSRKVKGSKQRELARLKVARIHEKITNSRNDMQHKVSLSLIKKYDMIALEDLNVKGMVKNHCLSKAVSDSSWSSFVTKLTYKAQWYGKTVIKIDRFFPSSKTCSDCGHIKESLDLSERSWICVCGSKHDRDVNASKNILKRALVIQSSGTDDYRNGAKVRPKEISKVSRGSGNEVSKKRVYVLRRPEADGSLVHR